MNKENYPMIPIIVPPTVICSKCGRAMDIDMWMSADLRYPEAPEHLMMPCQNRLHICNHCGKKWFSTDYFSFLADNVLVYEFWEI